MVLRRPDTLTSFDSIAPSLIQAVEDEVQAIRTSTRVRRVHAYEGRLLFRLGDYSRYRFSIDEDFRAPDDAPVEVIIGDEPPVPATIVRVVPDELIELSLNQFLGDYVREAFIESRLDFIWRRAAERLRVLRDTPPTPFLAEDVLKASSLSEYAEAPLGTWGEPPPDEDQTKAIAHALSHRVTFIHGPPGTGKSRTIGWLVNELVQIGERVLVAAHTNIAVDNALTNALKGETTRGLLPQEQVIRIGEPIEETLKDLRMPEVIRRLTAPLQEQVADLEERSKTLQTEWETLTAEQGRLVRHQELIRTQEMLQVELQSVTTQLTALHAEREEINRQLVLLDTRAPRGFMRLLTGGRYLRRRQRLQERLQSHANVIEQRNGLLRQYVSRLNEAKTAAAQASIPTTPQEYNEWVSLIAQRLQELSEEAERLEVGLNALREQIEETTKEILARAKLVGVTLSKICIEASLYGSRFDTVIIDELSNAPLPFIFVALGLPAKRVVFLGDPKQLPPICLSETEVARFWLAADLYERVPTHQRVTVQLRNQRRMPQAIVELVNSAVYEGKLRTPPEIEAEKLQDLKLPPFADRHIILVDTSSLNPWSAHDQNGSRYNLYSAEIVYEVLIQEILSSIGDVTGSVGIISPYRAQAQLIKKLCRCRLDEKKQRLIRFSTVHAFQGEERDIVVLDLTAGPPARPGFLSEQWERMRNPERSANALTNVRRLLNVGITRAKRRLVIIANRQYFERKLEDSNEFVRYLLANTRARGRWLDGEDYLRVLSASPAGTLRFLNASSFYRCLREDAARCRSSLAIVSPFVTRQRVQDLQDMIRALITRGIRVSVVTRPLSEMDFGVDAVRLLRTWGVEVIYRPRTHEKLTILDNQVAYYGSLNILSYKDTKETMQCLEGEEVVRLIAQFANVLGPLPFGHATSRTERTATAPMTREDCERELKKLRQKIAIQRHVMPYWVLYNNTIEALLDHPPRSEEALYDILEEMGERHLRDALAPFLDEIMAILKHRF